MYNNMVLSLAIFLVIADLTKSTILPSWTAPIPNHSLPLGGLQLVKNTTHTEVRIFFLVCCCFCFCFCCCGGWWWLLCVLCTLCVCVCAYVRVCVCVCVSSYQRLLSLSTIFFNFFKRTCWIHLTLSLGWGTNG